MVFRSTSSRVAAGVAALTLASVAFAAALARIFDAHPLRTNGGCALVYTPRSRMFQVDDEETGDEAAGDGEVGASSRPKDPVRVLRSGGVFQSATYTGEHRFEPVFEYYRGFDTMFAAESPLASAFGHGMSDVLMLGGGGFAYPKHLLTTREGISLDVVEIDPAVVSGARRWFFVDELEERLGDASRARGNRMRVFVADARAFLDQQDCLFEVSLPDPAHRSVHAGHRAHTLNPFGSARDAREYLRGRLRYNAIVNDCFVGAEPVASLATLEAAQAIRRRLVPGGVYLTNVVSRDNCGDLTFLRDQVATLSRAFLHVHIVPCEDERFGGEDNFLVIATDSDVSVPTAVPYDKVFLGEVLRD